MYVCKYLCTYLCACVLTSTIKYIVRNAYTKTTKWGKQKQLISDFLVKINCKKASLPKAILSVFSYPFRHKILSHLPITFLFFSLFIPPVSNHHYYQACPRYLTDLLPLIIFSVKLFSPSHLLLLSSFCFIFPSSPLPSTVCARKTRLPWRG